MFSNTRETKRKGKKVMKKKILTIVVLATVAISSYMLGTTKAKEVPSNYVDTTSEEFYVDMREVWDFNANEDNLFLCLRNGEGYYWKRGEND